jgi:DUF3099 family protein
VRRQQSPVLITGAPISPAAEFAARRRRYSLIMAMRIPCLVVAGILALGFGWSIAAAVVVVASVPLPWIAVLIANDRPPRKAEKVARYRPQVPQLPVPAPRVQAETIDMPRVVEPPVAA